MCCFRYGCADAPHSLMRPKVLRYCNNTKRNHACSAPSPQLTHTAALFSLCRSHSAWLRVLLSLENCFVIHAADRAPCMCARMTRRLPSHPATCSASWLRTYRGTDRPNCEGATHCRTSFMLMWLAGGLPRFLLACFHCWCRHGCCRALRHRSSYQDQSLSTCPDVKKRIFYSLFNI